MARRIRHQVQAAEVVRRQMDEQLAARPATVEAGGLEGNGKG